MLRFRKYKTITDLYKVKKAEVNKTRISRIHTNYLKLFKEKLVKICAIRVKNKEVLSLCLLTSD